MTKQSKIVELLPDQVAKALVDEPASSEHLAEMIAKVEARIPELVTESGELRAKALEPTLTTEAAESLRKQGEDLVFVRDRLTAALPRLQERHAKAQYAEMVGRFNEDAAGFADDIRKMRAEFDEKYSVLVQGLMELFESVSKLDDGVRNFNNVFSVRESIGHNNYGTVLELPRLTDLIRLTEAWRIPGRWPKPPSAEYLNALTRVA